MNRLTPINKSFNGMTFRNYKDWTDVHDVIRALKDIDNYMRRVLPNLKYAIHDITAGVIDTEDMRNQFEICIYTDSADTILEIITFRYLINEKRTIPYFERNLINILKQYAPIHSESQLFIVTCAESNTTLHQPITHQMLNDVYDITSLLKLAIPYMGNGCIEVKIIQDGEENTYIHSDNNGYRILTEKDHEPKKGES